VFSLSLSGFGLSSNYWLSLALMVPIGFFMMIQFGASNTLIQTMSPDNLRGRVMSVYSMMFMGMAPIGALVAGAVAERIGAPLAVAGGGVICLAASVVFCFWLPRVRASARELIAAQGLAGGDPPQEVTGAGLSVRDADDH
jgi:MFS family permease